MEQVRQLSEELQLLEQVWQFSHLEDIFRSLIFLLKGVEV
jgi:hypothetical protein